MSLTVNNLLPATSNIIAVPSGHRLSHQGKVVQTVYVRSDVRTTYTALNSGNGTQITQMNLTITPTRADSTIWLRWTMFYEMHHDCGFVVHRDSNLIGYNTSRGNVRFSNILTPHYDNDYASTPQNDTINWFDRPNTTSAVTYQLAVRSSSGTSYTFALNRSVSNAGADSGHEVGVSWGFAREISG